MLMILLGLSQKERGFGLQSNLLILICSRILKSVADNFCKDLILKNFCPKRYLFSAAFGANPPRNIISSVRT